MVGAGAAGVAVDAGSEVLGGGAAEDEFLFLHLALTEARFTGWRAAI